MSNKNTVTKECNRCGSCCKSGGPALHGKDLPLVNAQKIPFDHLVTVRKGEISVMPGGYGEIVGAEFIKLGGAKGSWCCRYYHETEGKGGCGIYDFRPLACRTLQCRDTSAILSLIGKDLLNRRSVIPASHPILPEIERHENEFPCDCIGELYSELHRNKPPSSAQKKEVERPVQDELAFRAAIVRQHGLSVGEELFFFGRPLFQLLAPLGVKVFPGRNGREVLLHWEQVPH